MSGITYDGDGTVNIAGQAIGSQAGTPDGMHQAVGAAREVVRDADVNTGVRNTGPVSVTITDSVVDGRHIGSARLGGPRHEAEADQELEAGG